MFWWFTTIVFLLVWCAMPLRANDKISREMDVGCFYSVGAKAFLYTICYSMVKKIFFKEMLMLNILNINFNFKTFIDFGKNRNNARFLFIGNTKTLVKISRQQERELKNLSGTQRV